MKLWCRQICRCGKLGHASCMSCKILFPTPEKIFVWYNLTKNFPNCFLCEIRNQDQTKMSPCIGNRIFFLHQKSREENGKTESVLSCVFCVCSYFVLLCCLPVFNFENILKLHVHRIFFTFGLPYRKMTRTNSKKSMYMDEFIHKYKKTRAIYFTKSRNYPRNTLPISFWNWTLAWIIPGSIKIIYETFIYKMWQIIYFRWYYLCLKKWSSVKIFQLICV